MFGMDSSNSDGSSPSSGQGNQGTAQITMLLMSVCLLFLFLTCAGRTLRE